MAKMAGFLSGTDEQRSINVSDNKLINLYPTTNNDGTVGAFITTPGLQTYITTPSGDITSGIYTASNGRCFMVAGSIFYEVTTGGVLTNRGTITQATVSRMTDNGLQLIVVNGIDGWIYTFATNVLVKITAAYFPNGCKTVTYMNGRFAVTMPNTQDFRISYPLNGIYWDSYGDGTGQALNQTVDANPDYIIGGIASNNEYVAFCETSSECYYDTGDATASPWKKNVSGIFEVGCIAPYSIAKIDNSVMWLGRASTGLGVVYRLNGYTPVRLSSYSVEYAIQQMSDTSDAISFTYQQEGHHFYVITFPTGGKTFAYDINTQMWHERASFSAITGLFSRWEAQEYAYFDNKHLVCDYTDGKVYSLELSVNQDGGTTRKWVRSWRAPESDMHRTPHHKLTLELECGVGLVGGVDPQIMLRYSNDAGHTWSSEKWRSMGNIGEFSKRVNWYRLGMTSGQPRVYEVSGTENVRTVLLAAYLE